jgi:uncharacterized protein (TIGR00299 family) protein
MKAAYLDPVCGISGDMFVAAFLDAGLPLDALKHGLGTLPLSGYKISTKTTLKNHVSATSFIVEVTEAQHEHRTFPVIRSMIEGSGLPSRTKESAIKTFSLLAGAEGEVHGVDPEEVTFHEVGAVDSIVDIVAASIALETMGVKKMFVGPLPTGRGTVDTAHGPLPVPAPATAMLLKGFEIVLTGIEGELVTPTGAAIIKAHGTPVAGRAPAIRIESMGAGAGSRDFESLPNIARVFVGELRDEAGSARPVDVIETTLDDTSPQTLGYLTGRLLEAGAYDAFMTSVTMKKSRPGVLLTVLCAPGATEELARLIFAETPTLGLRVSKQHRYELQRSIEKVSTKYGEVPVKVSVSENGTRRGFPEHDACASIAKAKGLPLREVWEEARRAWEKSQE